MRTTTQHCLIICISLLLGSLFAETSQAIQSVTAPTPSDAAATERAWKIRELKNTLETVAKSMERAKTKIVGASRGLEIDRFEFGQISKVRENVTKSLDELSISAASFDDIIRHLQTQRVQLTIELAGLEARQESLQRVCIEAQQKHVDKTARSREIVMQLIESQRKDIETMLRLQKNKSVSESGVRKARQNVLATELRYAQLGESNNSNQANSFDAQLSQTSLDRSETRAKLDTTKRLLKEYTSARSLINESRSVDRQFSEAELALESKSKTIHQWKLSMAEKSQLQAETVKKLKVLQDEASKDENDK